MRLLCPKRLNFKIELGSRGALRIRIVKITFYGGAGEIGGNKIQVEDWDTKIFLDFGMSFSDRRKFYSEPWLSPKDERSLLELGMLPKINGIYSFDRSQPSVDAVFLSHSHTDHSMYSSFLKSDIPVYCGETSATLLRVQAETRPKGFERDISGVMFNTFRTGDRIKVGSIELQPIHVDHSVPAAYGFIVYTSDGALVYAGDVRLHGVRPELTKDFIEKAGESDSIVLLCEGTNIMQAEVSSEEEVLRKVERVVSRTPGLVLVGFSQSDIDRLRTFREAAHRTGRSLAISFRQAHLLNVLKEEVRVNVPDVVNDSGIVVYQKKKKRYFSWEEKILDSCNVKDASEIKCMQHEVMLFSSFYDLGELVNIEPEAGGAYIYSSSEPFNEEQQIEYGKFINWLDHFGLSIYHIHSSGHIFPDDLRWAISEIGSKKLIPIHTEHPEMYARWASKLVKETLVPQPNGSITINR